MSDEAIAADIESRLAELGRLRERATWLHNFEADLRDIDGQLSLVRATKHAATGGLKPGYWHVKRDNPQTLASYLPIQGPDGEFAEPHSGVLDQLRRNDLQRPGALEEIRKAQLDEEAARKKAQHQKHLERSEEIAGRIKAIDSPGVRPGGTWTKKKKRGH